MSSTDTAKPPFPPFTLETARQKVKAAQNGWNTKNPALVKNAYTEDCVWRNRDEFFSGHEAIVAFLEKKWKKENGYRLRKELFAFTDDKIAVQFWYEFFVDDEAAPGGKQWYRCYGLEDWTFAADGRMKKRQMSGNDVKISEGDRWYTEDVEDVNTVDISGKHW